MNPTLGYLFNALAFGVGGWVYWSEGRRRQLHRGRVLEVALWGALCGIGAGSLGQFLYEALLHRSALPAFGGKTIIAGVLGGWFGVEVAKRRLGIRESTASLWALALPAGEVFGRIGCWFHGCCFGREAHLPWSVYQHDAWRHPTQFYLALAAALNFLIVTRYRDSSNVFYISLLVWAASRWIIEPLRESSVPSPWVVPTVCGILVGLCLLRLWISSRGLTLTCTWQVTRK